MTKVTAGQGFDSPRLHLIIMKDRFDLEQEIVELGSFSQHLKDLAGSVLNEDLDCDEIANALNGISVLLEIHENKLFQTMSECFNLK